MKPTRWLWGLACLGVWLAAVPARGQDSIDPEDLAKVKAAEAARIAAVDKVYHSVVAIYGQNRGGGGSGVIYLPDGYVLTNFHVVQGARTKNGQAGLADKRIYPWKLVGMDPGGDLAIIKLSPKDGHPNKEGRFTHSLLGDSNRVRVGDWCMAMGNPFLLAEDETPTVTLGVVSGIERYQPGQGGGYVLVYGNCIQIDTSINPGNSGGPLFNLAGQVVGINGRGSFEERGRVNVGVGYAISAEQIKNFLPEMEATKIAQHATLDATFRDMDGEVICDGVNYDGLMGKLGLDLRDRLVMFEGQVIRSADHFTNIISTLPAGWPTEVVWERQGQRRSAWVRLEAVPYPNQTKEEPKAKEAPAPHQSFNEGRWGFLAAPAVPATQRARGPRIRPPATQPGPIRPIDPEALHRPREQPLGRPGVVTDAAINKEVCARILRDWTAYRGGAKALAAAKAWQLDEENLVEGRKAGVVRSVIASDGRSKVTAQDGPGLGALAEVLGDGRTLWPLAARVLLGDVGVDDFAKVELQGADKTQNTRAYRMLVEDAAGQRVILWFSVMDAQGQRLEPRLLKVAAADGAGREGDLAVSFYDYRPAAGMMLPQRRVVVRGLAEMFERELTALEWKSLDQVPAVLSKSEPHAKTATTQPAGN